MSTSRDYRTPRFVLDPNLIPDGSIPPAKLQSGISGSLLQNNSVPPAKLQSGISGSLLQDNSVPPAKLQSGIPGSLLQDNSVPPAKLQSGISGSLLQDNSVPPDKLQSGISGSLLQADSVPLSALAPQVRSYLRLLHSAPFATYPDTSRGLYRLVNAYGVWSVTAGDTVSDNVLIVVPIIPDRNFSLVTVGVVCNSVTTSGNLVIGLYSSTGSLLSSASRTINATGLLSTSFSPTVNLQAGTLYYLGFLKTGGNFTLTVLNYLSLEYVRVIGTSVFLVGVMRFSATTLPSDLNGLTLMAEGGARAPALLAE